LQFLCAFSARTDAPLAPRDPRRGKENSPQAFQPAGCPVDCLGLTEVVTLVAPRSFRCRAQRVPGGSELYSFSPYSRIVCERLFPIRPTKGSSRTPLRATALRLSHLTWSGTATVTFRTCHPTTSFPVYRQSTKKAGDESTAQRWSAEGITSYQLSAVSSQLRTSGFGTGN
jgi:hypothetical protein